MNVFDVHVNRSPIAGTLTRVVYVPGKFLNADLDKASDDNERQYFIVEAGDGTRVAFTQIAGLVARRIMRFVEEGTQAGRWRTRRPDPLRQPCRCVSAGGLCAGGDRRAARDWRAKPCWRGWARTPLLGG